MDPKDLRDSDAEFESDEDMVLAEQARPASSESGSSDPEEEAASGGPQPTVRN